jgi:anti-sigma regulatory factor (Ser/Thr protein kinase)
MIKLGQRVHEAGFLVLLRELAAGGDKGVIELDMRQVKTFAGHVGPAFSSVLLTTLGQADAVVYPPAEDELLARTGIAFALVNRPGRTLVAGKDPAALWPDWRESWVPGSRATVEALFTPEAVGESADEPNVIGTGYAAFVNPHLSRPRTSQHEVVNLLHPWLRTLTGIKSLPDPLLEALGVIVTELLENVRQHASRTDAGDPSKSLLHVWRTRGEEDRVYVSVLDDGPGIITTARSKIVGGDMMAPADLLRDLLIGKAPRRNPARGLGLPDVWKHADSHRAGLWITTGDMALSCEGDGEPAVQTVPTGVRGTVVTLRFPVGG